MKLDKVKGKILAVQRRSNGTSWGWCEVEAWLKVICRYLDRQCVSVSQQCTLAAKTASNIFGLKQSLDWAKGLLPLLSAPVRPCWKYCAHFWVSQTQGSHWCTSGNGSEAIKMTRGTALWEEAEGPWQPGGETKFGRTQKQITVTKRNIYCKVETYNGVGQEGAAQHKLKQESLYLDKNVDMWNIKAFSLGVETWEVMH